MRLAIFEKKSAFTLLETLISGVIIVLVVTASLAAGRTIAQSTYKSQETSRMNNLAFYGLDKVKALRDGGQGLNSITIPREPFTGYDLDGYLLDVTVAADPPGSTDTYLVKSTVTSPSLASVSQSELLTAWTP